MSSERVVGWSAGGGVGLEVALVVNGTWEVSGSSVVGMDHVVPALSGRSSTWGWSTRSAGEVPVGLVGMFSALMAVGWMTVSAVGDVLLDTVFFLCWSLVSMDLGGPF